MDFLKNIKWPTFFKAKRKSYDNSQWQTIYGSETAFNNLLEANREWVFIANDKVSNSVAGIRFKVMKYKKGQDDEEVFDGDLVDFLYMPGNRLSGKNFFYLNTGYKELTGNAFWLIDRKAKKLIPLVSTCVTPVLDAEKKNIVSYKYSYGASIHTYPAEDVLHDRYVDPRRPYWGTGRLEKIARWVDTNSYATEFNRNFFINGASFGGFITTQEESQERIELIKTGLQNEHVGVKNAHRIAILPQGSDFKPATANMTDMQFAEMDDRMRDKILSAFGVPKTLVGFTTDVNRASAEASEYIYAKYTIKPIVDQTIEFMNEYIIPLFGKEGFYFSYDEFIPANMEVILKERELSLNHQAYKTINEVRSEAGLPPIDGGDVIWAPPFQEPIGEVTDNKNFKRDKHVRRKKSFNERLEDIAEKGMLLLENKSTDNIEISTKSVDPTEREKKDALKHKEFVGRIDAYEKLMADKVRDFNQRQQREVVQKLARLIKGVKQDDLFDYAGEVSILVDMVSPLLKGLMTEQATLAYTDEDLPGEFDTESPSLKKIVEASAARMSKSYNHTTLVLLKQTINEGIKEGLGLSELTKKVSGVYDFADKYRARQVAHTESFYVANKGSLEAYKQSKVVRTIRWYTSEDNRVCQFCEPLNGKVVGVDEVFYKKGDVVHGANGGAMAIDYRSMDVPPLHPNCNCFIRADDIEVQQL